MAFARFIRREVGGRQVFRRVPCCIPAPLHVRRSITSRAALLGSGLLSNHVCGNVMHSLDEPASRHCTRFCAIFARNRSQMSAVLVYLLRLLGPVSSTAVHCSSCVCSAVCCFHHCLASMYFASCHTLISDGTQAAVHFLVGACKTQECLLHESVQINVDEWRKRLRWHTTSGNFPFIVFVVSVIVLLRRQRAENSLWRPVTACDAVFSVIATWYAVALLLEELRINHEPSKRAACHAGSCEHSQPCSPEPVCCCLCPSSRAYKKALMQVLQRQIGIPPSVEWPAEVIGICYIYRHCNLICGILDRSAHAILSHWGQRLPSSAPYPVLSVCYLCGCSEQQGWASNKPT